MPSNIGEQRKCAIFVDADLRLSTVKVNVIYTTQSPLLYVHDLLIEKGAVVMYRVGDRVSYIYNGMSGIITELVDETHVGVAWLTYDGRRHHVVMSTTQIELVAGGSEELAETAKSEMVSA
jgi:hypothetical protein